MATGTAKMAGAKLICARISNFRSLANVEVELGDLTILVGANNSGKTNLLDALQAAIGANRRTLGKEDIRLDSKETDVPKNRAATIDVLIRPTDSAGSLVDAFPAGSFWTALWGSGISQDETDFHDLVVIRTTLEWSNVYGEYRVSRKFLKEWKPFSDWLVAEEKATVATRQIEPIAMHYIDAKRDLDEDLRARGSFWRRLTDDLGLSEDDIKTFEAALTELNESIITKSDVLKHLRKTLAHIQSVISAEKAGIDIAPVARRFRDLSKGVDVTLSTDGKQPFPLTRHGMGTRSLASLLVFRAFASWREDQARKEGDSIHTLLALEEPEAHLHPQAQRALYTQIRLIPGQRIVSTHSPFFAGQSRLEDIRLVSKVSGVTKVTSLDTKKLKDHERSKLDRQVVASRGDILFSRALILFEGETEEQSLPIFAHFKWGATVHELGFSFVSVRGTNYFPFVWLAQALEIPWYTLSDGEPNAVTKLQQQLSRAGLPGISKCTQVIVIPNGNDYESQLIAEGYLDAVETAYLSECGANALDDYIASSDGKPGKKVGGVTQTRNYSGTGGRERAALDFMRENKTRFAAPVAQAIVNLSESSRRIPKFIDALFSKMSARLGPFGS